MSEQILRVPLSALRESPFNPRKTYDEADLQDLAESIKTQGVMQPIVVRPLPDGQADVALRYEIVFGHRRFRACALLPEYRDDTLGAPIIVRDLDDQQAACAQVRLGVLGRESARPCTAGDGAAHRAGSARDHR